MLNLIANLNLTAFYWIIYNLLGSDLTLMALTYLTGTFLFYYFH